MDNLPTLYNDQYKIDYFNKVRERKSNEVKDTFDIIVNTIKDVTETNAESYSKDPQIRYVVNMTDEIKDAIKCGKIKLDYNKKTGELYAQLRDENNKFGPKLSIKEELIEKGVQPDEAIDVLELKLIEEKINNIIDVLNKIGEDVDTILEGQQNDRIALYYSGLNIFLESQRLQDNTFKMYLTSQAIKTLSDSNAQIVESIKSDIKYLLEEKYKDKRGKSVQIIKDKMDNVNKSFQIIYLTTRLKAAIYYDLNELPAMLSVLDEFGNFLKGIILPYVPKLIEYDIKDTYLDTGIWESRAELMLEMNDIKKELLENKVLYLERKDA